MRGSRFAGALAIALLAPACIYPYGVSSPAPPPPRAPLPALEAEALKPPQAAKSTRIVLDVQGGSARVTEVLREAQFIGAGGSTVPQAASTKIVCEHTPCLAELEVGDHDLRFAGTKTGELTPSFRLETKLAASPPIEYRVVLSARKREPTQLFKTSRVTAVIGFLLVAGGLGGWAVSEGYADQTTNENPWRIPLITTASVGLVTMIVSTILQLQGQGEYVPGSSASWAIGPGR